MFDEHPYPFVGGKFWVKLDLSSGWFFGFFIFAHVVSFAVGSGGIFFDVTHEIWFFSE